MISKILMRVVGTLTGLLGLGMFHITLFLMFKSITERNLGMILFVLFPLAAAVYLIYVAYLVWFRFSPITVRHICRALAFYVVALLMELFDPARDSKAAWPMFAFLGCLVVVYFAYAVVSDQLIRLLFPASEGRTDELRVPRDRRS